MDTKLVVERDLRHDGNVSTLVNVSHSKLAEPAQVCVRSVKKVFGFTPLKNKRYVLSLEVKSIDEEDLE